MKFGSSITAKKRLPIIITCPRGGTKTLKDIPPRKSSRLPCRCKSLHEPFRKDTDIDTEKLTERIAANIFAMCESQIYMHIAEVNRKWIDFNRHADCAFEPSPDRLTERIYYDYHMGIKKR